MKHYKLKPAFTIIELFICIAIIGVVLTAAAIALDACVANYEANKNKSDSVIKANQALSRITSDLRCATSVAISEPNTQCSMFTAEGSNVTYNFNESEGKLYLIESGTVSHLICEGISSAAFEKQIGIDGLGQQYVKSVQIILTVGSGKSAQNACAAVVIRKNMPD